MRLKQRSGLAVCIENQTLFNFGLRLRCGQPKEKPRCRAVWQTDQSSNLLAAGRLLPWACATSFWIEPPRAGADQQSFESTCLSLAQLMYALTSLAAAAHQLRWVQRPVLPAAC